MVWHRGLLVCNDDEADAVETVLAEQAFACRILQKEGETAFVFAARYIPDIEFRNVQLAGVDGSSISLEVSGDPSFRSKALIIRAAFSVGLSLPANVLAELNRASPFRELFRSLGKPSDHSMDDGIATLRWDIDEAPLRSADVDTASLKLEEIANILQAREIEHRVTLFHAGMGEIRGQLDEVGDVFIGPDVYVTLRWLGPDGTPNHVTANTGEF
ncbi:MAG: hypothetical protein ABI650_07975, partial [Dokdonella sp.]